MGVVYCRRSCARRRELVLCCRLEVLREVGQEEAREPFVFDDDVPIAVFGLRRRRKNRLVAVVEVAAREPERRAVTDNDFDVVGGRESPCGHERVGTFDGADNARAIAELPVQRLHRLSIGLVARWVWRGVVEHHLQRLGASEGGLERLQNRA